MHFFKRATYTSQNTFNSAIVPPIPLEDPLLNVYLLDFRLPFGDPALVSGFRVYIVLDESEVDVDSTRS